MCPCSLAFGSRLVVTLYPKTSPRELDLPPIIWGCWPSCRVVAHRIGYLPRNVITNFGSFRATHDSKGGRVLGNCVSEKHQQVAWGHSAHPGLSSSLARDLTADTHPDRREGVGSSALTSATRASKVQARAIIFQNVDRTRAVATRALPIRRKTGRPKGSRRTLKSTHQILETSAHLFDGIIGLLLVGM